MVKQNIPYSSLATPCVLVDLDKLEANIREMSQLAAEAGVRLRPHVKVHGSAAIAKMQLEAGACGIEVGAVNQAEPMAEGGIDDILVAHPFYGDHKLETFKRLLNRPKLTLKVAVDMLEQAEDISRVAQVVGRKVPVVLKIDTNLHPDGIPRYGVLPGEPALNLAKKLCQLPGIQFKGIYAHEMGGEPTAEGLDKVAFQAASMMAETARMLRKEDIPIEYVSVGASPTFRATCRYLKEGKFPEITEIHPGNCVIGDILYMMDGGNTREACAATVLTTVMSTAHTGWAIIDAGFKTFGESPVTVRLESPGFLGKDTTSFGSIQGRPDLLLGQLHAETSQVYYTEPDKGKLNLGDRLEIVPNNATLAISIHEQLYGVRKGVVEKVIPVTGRGRGI